MTKCAPVWRLLLLVCLAFPLVGCSQFKRSSVEEEKDPHFLEAKRRATGLDYRGAIESYERALQSNPNNSAAHFELGLLYDRQLNDYASAVYHYQKHLNLRTNSPHADFAKVQVNYCKQELAKTHSYAVINRDTQRHLERLAMTNEMYRKRIDLLENELARGPRYITNFVTNFVKLPEFNQQGPRTLTKPTTIVEAPDPPESKIVEDDAPPKVQQRPRTETPKVAGSQRNGNSREESRPSGSRTSPSSRTPQTATARTRSHKVRPGETMQVVARRYNISVAELRAANPGLGSGTRAGQVLNIPQK